MQVSGSFMLELAFDGEQLSCFILH
jgi:hypothetical protein